MNNGILTLNEGDSISISIGAVGAGKAETTYNDSIGLTGGTTSFGTYLSALGGEGGIVKIGGSSNGGSGICIIQYYPE